MSFLVLLVLSAVLGCFAPTATTSESNNSSIAIAIAIAKPNCSDRCGNVMIPFPFGLTENCSLNSNFSITCNHSDSPPKPYIPNSKVEIIDISVEGQLSVMKYIARICYYKKGEVVSPSESWLWTSNFYVNQIANKFVAVGCDTVAFVTGYGDERSNKIGGCRASCDSIQDVENGTCNGIGCCETEIPNMAKNVYFSVGSIYSYNQTTDVIPCNYAFVVKNDEFNFSPAILTKEWDVVKLPMVLDWIISNQTCNTACQGNTSCVPVNDTANGEGYRCACKEGYEGNPYLSGCKDIDECANGHNNCSQNATCSNTEGGYECFCKEGYHGDGKGESGCQLPKDDCKDNGKGCTSYNQRRLIMLHALGIALFTLLLIGVCCLYLGYRRRKSMLMKEKFFRENGGLILKQKIDQGTTSSGTTRIFTAEELRKATNNYDQTRIIGQGGFGVVYKGHLLDGRTIAVKRPKMMDSSQVEQFINEVIVLSQINHRNIVKLFGCCLETETPLLVYEFVNNGTLSEHLYRENKESTIPWPIRLRIATETAEVLSYLHSAASPPIIHRDVKPANILLDNDYTARVSDFGASRLVLQDETQLITMVQGTLGYLDPEYLQTQELTEKSDVYSFGVVLVELLTGRRAVFFNGPEEERNLSQHFLSLLKENQLFKILDDNIVCCEGNTEELQEVALLAKRCLNVKGDDRPTMKEVAMELGGLRRATKHPWANNSETSTKSQALLTNPPIPSGYDATFSITTTEYDSLKHHMELPVAVGR